jgi:SAM-dependent methyltransferase
VGLVERGRQDVAPTGDELARLFRLKYGDPATTGWAPRMWHRLGYFTPDDYYEATVSKMIGEGCAWIDVGCGRDLFPSNRMLSRELADRCVVLVGVDPDDTLDENPYVHERVKSTLDDFRINREFDVVTLRMVAEHIGDPAAAVASLARITRPGGKVIVFTVNQWTPVSVLAKLIPFRLHHPIKRRLWKTEEKDTFTVAYRMNTRKRLAQLFGAGGFIELYFAYLDDCRTFYRSKSLHTAELWLWLPG